MAYADFQDLLRRAAANKEMRDKTLSISKNPKHNGYQRGLASAVKWLNEYIF